MYLSSFLSFYKHPSLGVLRMPPEHEILNTCPFGLISLAVLLCPFPRWEHGWPQGRPGLCPLPMWRGEGLCPAGWPFQAPAGDSQSLRPRVSTAPVLSELDPLIDLGVSTCRAWAPHCTVRVPTILTRRTLAGPRRARKPELGMKKNPLVLFLIVATDMH